MTLLDPQALRRAFGSFMTGVTVVTTRDCSGKPVGFTANSFTSVSLDPPLLLVCPGKFLSSYDAFETCAHFAVNILAEGQEDVSNTFAGFKGDRFARVPHGFDADGIPLIDGALAQFSCRTHRRIEAGDHSVLIGQVTGFRHEDRRGLGYSGGRYFSIGLERQVTGAGGHTAICGAILDCDGLVLLEKTGAGYRPPEVIASDRAAQRTELAQALQQRGVTAQLRTAYSVFDDGQTHWSYILGRADAVPTGGDLVTLPPGDLPGLTYTTPAIAKMMARYALEAETRDFSLYLGDVQRGETHSLSDRS